MERRRIKQDPAALLSGCDILGSATVFEFSELRSSEASYGSRRVWLIDGVRISLRQLIISLIKSF